MLAPRQGTMAWSNIDLLVSGITNSGSIPITSPKPSHSEQAPKGLLKLNK